MQTSSDALVDRDTRERGTSGPFERWEGDDTGLWHVLLTAKHAGFTLANDTYEIASLILRSRWLAAARAHGPLVNAIIASPGQPVDPATHAKGLTEPFTADEGDHAALVRVLQSAHDHGLTLDQHSDEITRMIFQSRWRFAALTAGSQAS